MRAVVLEYHDVVAGDFGDTGFPGAAADSYKMTARDFDAHLEALSQAGRRVLNDVRSLPAHLPTDGLPVLITFDDGGVGAQVAADLLERRGWRGHFFMTTAQVGSDGFLGASDLRELHGRGHVIGSHSHTHPVRMARIGRAKVAEEWSTSVAILSDLLGVPVDVASVPGGYYADWIAAEAAAAGIRWLFTSEPVTAVDRRPGCSVLGRYTLRRTSPANRIPSLVARISPTRGGEWTVWNAKKLAKRIAGDAYLRLRSSLLGDGPGAVTELSGRNGNLR